MLCIKLAVIYHAFCCNHAGIEIKYSNIFLRIINCIYIYIYIINADSSGLYIPLSLNCIHAVPKIRSAFHILKVSFYIVLVSSELILEQFLNLIHIVGRVAL